jgi:spore maturation protein SpmA
MGTRKEGEASDALAREEAMARKGRHIALVIAGTMVLWIGLQFIAPALGLPGRYALLLDFAALAALIYAGANIFQLRRMRRDT